MKRKITVKDLQNYKGKKRYFSKEHEDLSLTAFTIFKDNHLHGSGIKTFYKICNLYKLNEKEKNINSILRDIRML